MPDKAKYCPKCGAELDITDPQTTKRSNDWWDTPLPLLLYGVLLYGIIFFFVWLCFDCSLLWDAIISAICLIVAGIWEYFEEH